MIDPLALTISVAVMIFSLWAMFRLARKSRDEWIRMGPHDPAVVDEMMRRVGPWEARRLARAIKEAESEGPA